MVKGGLQTGTRGSLLAPLPRVFSFASKVFLHSETARAHTCAGPLELVDRASAVEPFGNRLPRVFPAFRHCRARLMPRLQFTAAGFMLDGRPLHTGDWIEVHFCWRNAMLRGTFAWTPEAPDLPHVMSTGISVLISPGDDVRRFTPEAPPVTEAPAPDHSRPTEGERRRR